MQNTDKIVYVKIWATLSATVLGIADSIYILIIAPHLFWNPLDKISFVAFSILFYLFCGGIAGFILSFVPFKKIFKIDHDDKLSSLQVSIFFASVLGLFFAFKYIKFSLFGTQLALNLGILAGVSIVSIVVAFLIYYFLTKISNVIRSNKFFHFLSNKKVQLIIFALLVVLVFANFVINNYILGPNFYSLKKPNIILISLDTLSGKHVSCLGYDKATTPHIDELARNGVLFENATTQSKWTLPSHISIFTSVVPTVHQVNSIEKKLDDSFVTLAELLNTTGYYCGAFVDGSYDSWIGAIHGLDQGFSFYEHYPDQYNKYEKIFVISHIKNFVLDLLARYFQYPYMHAKSISNNVLGWLKHYRKDRPFFLFLHYYDIHADYFTEIPYVSPHPYDKMFSSAYKPDFTKLNPNKLGGARLLRELYKKIYLSDKVSDVLSDSDINYFTSLYDGGIRYVDEQIGMLIDNLKKMGLFDNTLIILTSDHGEEFLEHEKFLHGQFYEEIVHVPLIMSYPKLLPANVRITKQARLIDIAPTIEDILGLEKLDQFQGHSLLNYVKSPEKKEELIAFGGQDKPLDTTCFVKKGNVKVIFNSEMRVQDILKNGKPVELYFLEKDPYEKRNKANENKNIVQQFSLIKDQWIKKSLELKRNISNGKSKQVKVNKSAIEKLKALGYIK